MSKKKELVRVLHDLMRLVVIEIAEVELWASSTVRSNALQQSIALLSTKKTIGAPRTDIKRIQRACGLRLHSQK